jgi:hypothetical protein
MKLQPAIVMFTSPEPLLAVTAVKLSEMKVELEICKLRYAAPMIAPPVLLTKVDEVQELGSPQRGGGCNQIAGTELSTNVQFSIARFAAEITAIALPPFSS